VIVCPHCNSQLKADYSCSSCGFAPPVQDGIPLFAPDLSEENEGFPADAHARLFELESGHFWFRHRNRVIDFLLRGYFPEVGSFCEVGCGTGQALAAISASFPAMDLTAVEIYARGLSFARTRVPRATFLQADLNAFPFVDEFDVVGVFDVLEHLDDDLGALRNIHHAVRPGGGIIVTVPQHQWLWSVTDEAACHRRRYSRKALLEVVSRAGFHPMRHLSFMTLLQPAMMASRLAPRFGGDEPDPYRELRLSAFLNMFFLNVCKLELLLLKAGIPFPVGGSLALLATKPS